MKNPPPPLHHLERPEVTQILLTSGRPPRAVSAEGMEIVGPSLSTEAIVSILFAAGGSRYLEDLGPKPTTWKLKLDGVGTVSVSAAQHGDDVEAQFTAPPGRALLAAPPSDIPIKPPSGIRLPNDGARRRSSPLRVAMPPASERNTAVTKPVRSRSSAGTALADRVPTKKPPRRNSEPAADKRRRGISAPAIEVHAGEVALTEVDADDNMPFEVEMIVPRRSAPPADLAHALAHPERPPIRATAREKAARLPGIPPNETTLPDLVSLARREGASDLHIVSGRPALVRSLGELSPRGQPIPPADVDAMVEACVPERLQPVLAETGSCDFALELDGHGRFRVNVSRQRTGYKVGLRFIASEMPTLVSLGLPRELGAATKHHQGLVVITGPTGHGKTCTLAALVDLLNRESTHHVITVEDPVEYVHGRRRALISQREVGSCTRSFASALKASLREDPDVIVVGELRDTETVRMALAASETGHLVLGTMNTENAAKAIDRLVDLFPPADQAQVRTTLAGGLKMVASQRLIPRLDQSGMACAVELLPGSIALWNLIRDNKTYQVPSLMQRGKGIGVLRLNDALFELAHAGVVSEQAAIAESDAPDELEAQLRKKQTLPGGVMADALGSGRVSPRPSSRPPPEAGRGLFQRAGALFGKKGS